jgi:retron-type reverse transcriptase
VKNKKAPGYEGTVWTPVDRVLVQQRSEIIFRFSRLRLHLTRFKWNNVESQVKARSVIIAWCDELLADLEVLAKQHNLKSDRLFRNLLEIVPNWALSPVFARLEMSQSLRDRTHFLSKEAIAALDPKNSAWAYREFYKHQGSLSHPRIVIAIAPISSDQKIELWASWIAIQGDDRIEEFARWVKEVSPAADLVKEILARLAISTTQFSKISHLSLEKIPSNQYTLSTTGAAAQTEINNDFEINLNATIDAITEGRFSATSWTKVVQYTECGTKHVNEIDKALNRSKLSWSLPPRPSGQIEKWDTFKPLSVRAFEIIAAGSRNAALQLSKMRANKIEEFRNWVNWSLRTEITEAAVRLVPVDGSALRCGLRHRRLAVTFLQDYRNDLGSSLALIPRWRKLGNGHWQPSLLEQIASWEGTDFALFCKDAEIRSVGWKKLALPLREALLTKWVALATDDNDLIDLTAQYLPDLVRDAVKWGGFVRAIPSLISHLDQKTAIQFLDKLRRGDCIIGLMNSAEVLENGVNNPVIQHFLSKDNRILVPFISKLSRLFTNADLQSFDLEVLLRHASHSNGLVKRISQTFPVERTSQVLKLLSVSKCVPSRQRAAFELASLVGVRYLVVLHYLSTRPLSELVGTRFDESYHSWLLPKKKGGSREISALVSYLKAVQRKLLDQLLSKVTLHQCATGFRPGYSIKDNALPHVGKRVVLNVDISGFFQNTSLSIIRSAINRSLPLDASPSVRRLMFDLCSRAGGLPTGAPTSPAIANIGLIHFDYAINKACLKQAITYTRYADDLTFSGDDPGKILPYVEEWLERFGYKLDRKKTNFFRRGRRQVVTGLVVNDKVSVPRSTRRKLRAALHNLKAKGKDAIHWHGRPMQPSELQGRLAFLNSIDSDNGGALLKFLRDKPSE